MKFRTKIAAAGTVAAVVAMSGAALALWNSTGSGTAEAGSVSIQASSITPGINGGDLYPGAPGKTITVKVSNPNPYPVEVRLIPGANAVTQGACTGTYVTVETLGNDTAAIPQAGGAGTVIPAKSTVDGSGTYTMNVAMAADAPDACAGKTFTFNLAGAKLLQVAG
jgi:hypothetical protein